MPSPFPGMDPYLEAPRHWPDVHQRLIYALSVGLRPVLPTAFVARLEERLYIAETANRSSAPRADVAVVEVLSPRSPSSTLSLAERPHLEADAPIIVTVPAEEVREPYIEIVAVGETEQVVTVIEVLSPKNKWPGTGRTQYQRKQRQLLNADVHLLEIDLLRAGPPTVAANAEALEANGIQWDYIVSLHRAGAGAQYETWPRRLRERLPVVWVPLTAGFPDVPLDVQAALDRVYDEGYFDRSIDYRAEPDPPLSPEDAAWADALLRPQSVRR